MMNLIMHLENLSNQLVLEAPYDPLELNYQRGNLKEQEYRFEI